MSTTTCAVNGCDLRASEIPPESLAKGFYGPWDGVERRYFSRMIGFEVRGLYDGVAFWICPECGARWHRFPDEAPYARIRAAVESLWAAEAEAEEGAA